MSVAGRLARSFSGGSGEARTAFIPYLTHGYPSPSDTPRLLERLAGAGAEVFLTEGPAGCERVRLPLDRPVRALERVGMVLSTRDSAVAAVDARFAGQVVVTRRGAS